MSERPTKALKLTRALVGSYGAVLQGAPTISSSVRGGPPNNALKLTGVAWS